MANTLNLGTDGNWATKEGSTLAYNDENDNYKPLPFTFTRASSATVVNKAGLIETVGNGIPRIDFLGNTQGALKLEPQSTNLINYSNYITSINNVTASYNAAESPEGILNAPIFTATSTDPFVRSSTFSITTGNTYTMSFYIKGFGTSVGKTCAASATTLGGTTFTLTDSWQRISYSGVSTSTRTNAQLRIDAPNVGTVVGEQFSVWGLQTENQSYATSYISTQGSVVTRVADSCNNGANEQVINSTEGVLYAEVSLLSPATSSAIISLSDGSSNRLYFEFFTANRLYTIIENGSSSFNTVQTITQTNNNKLAFKYSASSCKLYINGTGYSFGGLNFSSGTLDTLNFASSNGTSAKFIGNVTDVRVYNTLLTDSELATLTQV